jgi:rhamnosyltransferase
MDSGTPHCTVVIPTKNAMPLFRRVLPAVLGQRTPWRFDVLVIDSGSSDGTDTYAEAQPGVRVMRIPTAEFGHGRTRNRAIAATAAPFVALITHDAEPVDADWLANLVAPFAQDARIAGVFGRHAAWPDADPFTRRDLDGHFAGFLAHPLVLDRETDAARYASDLGWRQLLHFFSDNNACLRRSVWEAIPYPDVEFAEDQVWARTIIEHGWRKAYAPDAVVYHSHDYGVFERLQRAFDEARSFHRDFGYDLAPSLPAALRSIVWLMARDGWFALRGPGRGAKLAALPKRLAQDVMLVLGHCLGNRHQRLSPGLQAWLSRDRQIFLGGRVPG